MGILGTSTPNLKNVFRPYMTLAVAALISSFKILYTVEYNMNRDFLLQSQIAYYYE